ncbi:ATP-binding cassette domain-containing protein [Rhizobium ruizarguesonis]|nr:ATP-binding cassette domain-containing protein [Rhizobium ruizarguesonis]TBD08043.1 ATP-binding cassette domain-containing protein [Rhizobium ruizarguesonis]TBD24787.1 ATP-binding cassette domain-containing protein [Rhizobium ruizarguesonis]TBD31281.1 ATP-binding cassette domain-containing protein [Rhizobium ruizarguesonis]TBD33889.1 ATP-binding cassette domain-containing protein [Rhizobium ruizarguesonis]
MPGRHGFDATQEAAIHGRTLLEVDKVSRIYGIRPGKVAEAGPNAIRAVNEASFVLKSGETLGIVGESGSGKSTLARMLLGLDKPTIGEIRFGGKDLNAMSRHRKLASQNPSFNAGSTVPRVLRNVSANLSSRATLASANSIRSVSVSIPVCFLACSTKAELMRPQMRSPPILRVITASAASYR